MLCRTGWFEGGGCTQLPFNGNGPCVLYNQLYQSLINVGFAYIEGGITFEDDVEGYLKYVESHRNEFVSQIGVPIRRRIRYFSRVDGVGDKEYMCIRVFNISGQTHEEMVSIYWNLHEVGMLSLLSHHDTQNVSALRGEVHASPGCHVVHERACVENEQGKFAHNNLVILSWFLSVADILLKLVTNVHQARSQIFRLFARECIYSWERVAAQDPIFDTFISPRTLTLEQDGIRQALKAELHGHVDWFMQLFMTRSDMMRHAYTCLAGIGWEVARVKCGIDGGDGSYTVQYLTSDLVLDNGTVVRRTEKRIHYSVPLPNAWVQGTSATNVRPRSGTYPDASRDLQNYTGRHKILETFEDSTSQPIPARHV